MKLQHLQSSLLTIQPVPVMWYPFSSKPALSKNLIKGMMITILFPNQYKLLKQPVQLQS